ncbi:SETMAR [Cordylochernes scorpioides]|uniref:SETMAR n=1 Tax=Cordylochernes scorpioides TaxID=51811 RepID=A0ABY6JYU5_9ARAC|nr:SETMAR [Cordylochernes scorpioides]
MAISEQKSAHFREVLLFAYNWEKSATEAHRMLEEVYSDHALSKSQCYSWFKKFQSGDFELDNEPHGNPPQKFEDAELQALLDEDSTQMQEKLAKQLQVSQGAVSLRLNSLGMTQKLSRWSWGLPGQFPKQMPRPNRFGKKAMLCIWWDQTGVVYFELLKPGKMVNTSRYEQQMHSLREALNEKRPEWREKHNNLILQNDNAPAHNATVVKNTIKDLGWELFPHPPYSPDLAPSNYHLFTSLGHALKTRNFLTQTYSENDLLTGGNVMLKTFNDNFSTSEREGDNGERAEYIVEVFLGLLADVVNSCMVKLLLALFMAELWNRRRRITGEAEASERGKAETKWRPAGHPLTICLLLLLSAIWHPLN